MDFYVSKFALSMQIWQLYQVIMYIERTEEEKKKKKGKTNSFVVINQINYPSFNEDWCTNATFFLSLSLLLSTFVTSIASEFFDPSFSPFLRDVPKSWYLEGGKSRNGTTKLLQLHLRPRFFFRFDDPIREKWSSR